MNSELKQWKMKLTFSTLYLVASKKGLRGAHFKPQTAPLMKSLSGSDPQAQILSKAVLQLEEYLNGKRATFDLPFDVEGTDFQKRVWKELARIPYGQTRSYQEIAKKIKNEKASRAVGTANGKNPLSIIVPCHRVIAADGTLGGYSGGLPIKIKLLEIEGITGWQKIDF